MASDESTAYLESTPQQQRRTEMATLHIQHPITDFETWTTAFNRFREARRNAGVQAQRIQRPVDNERYVVIELDFETVDQAQTFLGFLRSTIWTNAANSPGLVGTPEALVLEAASVD